MTASVSVASVSFGGIGSLVGVRVRVRDRVIPNLVGDRVRVRALVWAGVGVRVKVGMRGKVVES